LGPGLTQADYDSAYAHGKEPLRAASPSLSLPTPTVAVVRGNNQATILWDNAAELAGIR